MVSIIDVGIDIKRLTFPVLSSSDYIFVSLRSPKTCNFALENSKRI